MPITDLLPVDGGDVSVDGGKLQYDKRKEIQIISERIAGCIGDAGMLLLIFTDESTCF